MEPENAQPQLQIYDTLSKSKRNFTPTKPGEITMYQCGPTVYWTQHIGNMRAMVMSDLIRRSLAYLYPDHTIRFARNYTDVGHLSGDNEGDADTGVDRMEKGAEREGVTPAEIAKKYTDQFNSDIGSMGCLAIDSDAAHHSATYPAATSYITEMRDMVQTLLDHRYAYVTPLAIYFDISKKSDYTKLSRQDITKLVGNTGHGDVSDPDKRNTGDFSLWFFRTGTHANALQYWDSPKFPEKMPSQECGFPGWHIECSAMIRKILGTTIDIHMGGIEHVPIHHTNEIAQSETMNHCCDHDAPFVQFWMHNEHLNVDGGKMSKSEGTAYSLQEIIDRGYSAMDLRYFFLQAHYRSKQNFTWEALDASKTAREKIIARIAQKLKSGFDASSTNDQIESRFIDINTEKEIRDISPTDLKIKKVICSDFNTPELLSIFQSITKEETTETDFTNYIKAIDSILGCNFIQGAKEYNEKILKEIVPENIILLAEQRIIAKNANDWTESDRLRKEIQSIGYEVVDTIDGYIITKMR
jgi:cysteinyl-tRNA synthetase